MADAKLSAISAVTTIGATDLLYVAASGTTSKKITGANFKASITDASALTAAANVFTVSPQQITTDDAAHVALKLKASVSQSANMLAITTSDDTVQVSAGVDSNSHGFVRVKYPGSTNVHGIGVINDYPCFIAGGDCRIYVDGGLGYGGDPTPAHFYLLEDDGAFQFHETMPSPSIGPAGRTSDALVYDFQIIGQAAYGSATTHIDGGSVQVTGGTGTGGIGWHVKLIGGDGDTDGDVFLCTDGNTSRGNLRIGSVQGGFGVGDTNGFAIKVFNGDGTLAGYIALVDES